jgi:hypothetical protein
MWVSGFICGFLHKGVYFSVGGRSVYVGLNKNVGLYTCSPPILGTDRGGCRRSS